MKTRGNVFPPNLSPKTGRPKRLRQSSGPAGAAAGTTEQHRRNQEGRARGCPHRVPPQGAPLGPAPHCGRPQPKEVA
jgi:hypothetical protein